MIYLIGAMRWLHIAMGILWVGGTVIVYLAVYPTLLKLPAQEAQRFSALLPKYMGPIMSTSGSLIVLLGIVLGTVFGRIQSLEALVSPYGITWMVALVLSLVLSVVGAKHESFVGPLWDGDKIRAGAQSRLRTCTTLEMIGFGVILACMVLMHYGY